jgi:His-Xaa-Ser system radical SAM maturase HxsC
VRLWSMGQPVGVDSTVIARLTESPLPPGLGRGDHIAHGSAADLCRFGNDWKGYAGVLCSDPPSIAPPVPVPAVYAPPNLEYLTSGDVVALRTSGVVSVLYRGSSPHNTILATEQCNSFCLMCSQPPKTENDSHRIAEILRLLELIDPATHEVGISGGEPTLLGDAFLDIVTKARDRLPYTALHVLTNGRTFKDPKFAHRLGAIRHHDLMLGVPLYSDIDWRHDYVVQAEGAYDETLAGFYNLARYGVRTELRVVLHQQTFERLPRLAEFIVRNLPFVEHVALMGLEMFGFAPRNLSVLWIDPVDYAPQLEQATRTLARAGLRVSIYNHQLCTLPRSLWPFAVRSISDWKNVYLDACEGCGVREYCGGFFQSGTKKHSAHIRALPILSQGAEAFMDRLHRRYTTETSTSVDRDDVVSGG